MGIELSTEWVIGLITLTSLEIVLGIDNIILLTILVARLPEEIQDRARYFGLGLALVARLVLLSMAVWLTKLTTPLFEVFEHSFSGRDLVLLLGGLFLMGKATTEIFHIVEGQALKEREFNLKTNVASVMVQIVIFDLIFSIDSVLTAIGLTKDLMVMALAILISIVFMMVFAKKIGIFVERNPSIKVLALSFLVLIGVLLVAEAFHSHFERGYVYFAMAFSLLIEILNKRRSRRLKLDRGA